MTTLNDCDWLIDADGWLPAAMRIDSPNQDTRPQDQSARIIVIHAISLPPGEFGSDAVKDFFTNRLELTSHPYFASIADLRVSSHFFISRDGAVVQFVSCLARAWHAGISCWRGHDRCNDFSLGVEFEGDDRTEFTSAQYASMTRLDAALRGRFSIEDCVAHADIAPGRKTDPGPYFDWSHLNAGFAK